MHAIQKKCSSYISNASSLILSTCSSECDSDIPEETKPDNYDSTMHFSPTKLGATVKHLTEVNRVLFTNFQ